MAWCLVKYRDKFNCEGRDLDRLIDSFWFRCARNNNLYEG
jgi:hypothetical protein